MIQLGTYVRRLTFKQRWGPPRRGRRRDTKSIRVICVAPPSRVGFISPNCASISRARSPVADLQRRIFIALSYRRMGKASSGREFFTVPDVLSPMEFLSFSTFLSIPRHSLFSSCSSLSTYCISREPICTLLLPVERLGYPTDTPFGNNAKIKASENTQSIELSSASSDDRIVAQKDHEWLLQEWHEETRKKIIGEDEVCENEANVSN